MTQHESAEYARFREQARRWLTENAPRESRPSTDAAAKVAFDVEWRRRQHEGGWGHITWPKEYGGLGLTLQHQLIWYEELARANGPLRMDIFFVAVNHAGPTILLRGSEEQRTFYLPRIVRGEDIWCQGFSESGAGSDLASIKTRGVIKDGHIIVSGQKIWSSGAHHAAYQELLIRTDPSAGRHKGMTWVICPMDLSGITIRPIRNMAGDEDFCEVFYDDVKVPIENVVGEVDDGWSVAMSTLGFERGTASVPQCIELQRAVEDLIRLAGKRMDQTGRPVIEDDNIAGRLAAVRAQATSLRSLIYFAFCQDNEQSNAQGSMVRLYQSELAQRIYRIAIDILGPASLELGELGDWVRDYLSAFKHTIAGGTSEIQRNIIGERGLGLPR